jgi:hypothetical protein
MGWGRVLQPGGDNVEERSQLQKTGDAPARKARLANR